jgi:hypothetical protein
MNRHKQLVGAAMRRGHVYRVAADIPTLIARKGAVDVVEVGLRRASTFSGFCAHHDNDTFAALERAPLTCSEKQCALLGYRAIAREVYAKEAVHAAGHALDEYAAEYVPSGEAVLADHRDGTEWGLRALRSHKTTFERIVLSHDYSNLRSAVIEFDRVPGFMASTVRYPITDFNGNSCPILSAYHLMTGYRIY